MAGDLVFGIRLTADGSGYVGTVRIAREETERLGQSARKVGNDIEAANRQAMQSAVALGTTIGLFAKEAIAATVRWAAGNVTAAASLKDLHDVTGSEIEELSRLTNIAKVSGTSAEAFGDVMGRLAVRLSGTDEESTRAGKALAALGIQSRDPAKAMQELALKFSQYTDDLNKAAYAEAIFGRGGERLLPLLKDIAEQQGIAATVTTRQAEEAQRLEQQIRLLGNSASEFRDKLLGGMVPALNDLIEQFREGTKYAGGFLNALNLFSTLPTVKNIADVQTAILEVNKNLEDSEKKYATAVGQWINNVLGNSLEKTRADAAAKIQFLQLQAAQLRKGNLAGDTEFGDLEGAMARAANAKSTIGKAPGGPSREAKQAVADYTGEIQKLNDEMAKLTGADGGYAHLIAANEKYQADLRAGKSINTEQARALMQTAVAADQQTQEVKDLNDGWALAKKRLADAAEYESKVQDAISATTANINALVAGLDLETSTMLLTNDQRERAVALSKLQKDYDDGLIPTQEALAEAVGKVGNAFDRRDYAAAMKKSLDEQQAAFKQTFEHIRDTITDNLTNAFLNGEKLGKALVNSLKQLFGDLVLRPIISAVVSPIAGTATSLLAGGAQAAGGGGNLLGTASNLSSLSNLGGIGTTLSSIGSAYTAGAAGISAGAIGASEAALFGGVGAGAAVGAGGVGAGITAGLTAGLAAVPVAGWVALAGLVAYGIFKGFDKGPASRTATFSSGPASLAPDASRDAAFQGSSQFGTFGISKDKWLSPDDKGAGDAFKATLTAITTIDNKIADLVGTDQTKLITDALNAHSVTVGLGKEHTDINASGGPGAILQDRYTTVVSAIDAGLGQLVAHFQGTGDELANFVVNLVSLHEAVAGGSTILEDAQKQWDATQGVQASSTEKLRLMGDSVRDLSAQFDGSVASANALASATLQYKQAATEAIVAIHGLQKSLTDMFQATREHVEFAGLDKQSEYDLYKSKGSTLLETISQTNDPEVVSQLSQKINGYFVSAFDLLDPSEQLAHKQEFLDDLNNVDKQTHDRLDTIGGNISDNATDVFKGVNDALTKAGQQFLDAAKEQASAVSDMKDVVADFKDAVTGFVNAPPIPLMLFDNRSEVGNTG